MRESDSSGLPELLMDHDQLTKRYKTYAMNLCNQLVSNIDDLILPLDKKWCKVIYELGRLAAKKTEISVL